MANRSSHDSPAVAFVVMCIFLFPQILSAAVTLPLNGYCKPGRFFPILVDGSDLTHSALFSAEGCIPCSVDPQAASRTIVPMLAINSPRQLRWSDGSLPLQIPAENERLIATTTDNIAGVEPLFPGERLIPIHLLFADFMSAPPAAWESLDAILLDPELLAQVTDEQRSTLLAAGVVLAVTADHAPDQKWPWQKQGSLWVLRFAPAGPSNELVSEIAYAPTFVWNPGWSIEVRWRVMGAALLLVLITIALLLLQNRFAIVAVFGTAIFASAGIAAWRQSLGKIDRIGGNIIVQHGVLTQQDAWVYERAKESSTQTVGWAGWAHPIFSSAAGLTASKMELHLSSAGRLEFVYQAMPTHTMAFVRRDVRPGEKPAMLPEKQSPMQDLAKSDYLANGGRIAGEFAGVSGRWPGVVVETKEK